MTRKNNTAPRRLNDDNTVLRRMTGAAVLLVGGIAAVVSYMHIYKIAVQLGQPALAAWLMPLSVDGTVGAASAALLWAARSGQRSPWTARVMLTLGVMATLLANADFGGSHGIAGIILSAWPGVAFVGSAEVALGMVRKSASAAVAGPASLPDIDAVTVTSRPPLSLAWPRPDKPASVAAIEPAKPRPLARSVNAARPPSRDRRAASIVAKSPDISGAQLAAKLGLSERSGRRILATVKAQ